MNGIRVSSLCLCVSVVILSGCVAPQLRQPTRAIWVTRFDYKTPSDVVQIMDNCAAAGFNTVLFQVRGNGTAFYCSKFEPWATELGGVDPGWDPLALACAEAHSRKMQLHAWVNVMPGWTGPRPPLNPEQLYNKHPEWFWYDADGNRQPMVHPGPERERSWYVSLNPCIPEVRAYLVDVFRDLVSRYDVDGLHMDYIRFPNEPVVTGEKIPDYPRDARTLELFSMSFQLEWFRPAAERTPEGAPQRWDEWRTAQVTQLVREIRDMLRRAKPQAVLSASVGPVPASARKHFQDAIAWREQGLVDAIILMNYSDGPEQFGQRLSLWVDTQPRNWVTGKPRVPVVPGLWFGSARRRPENTAAAVRKQIELAREKTGNFCVFAYSSLFDSSDDHELARQNDEQRSVRQARRDLLLPVIKSLAQEDQRLAKKGL